MAGLWDLSVAVCLVAVDHGTEGADCFLLLSAVYIYTQQTEVVPQSLLMEKASLGFLP